MAKKLCKILFVFILVAACVVSCKKNKTEPEPAANEPIDTATYVDAWCRKYTEYIYLTDVQASVLNRVFVYAAFSKTPMAVKNNTYNISPVRPYALYVDGDEIDFSAQAFYKQLGSSNHSKRPVWEVSGDADGIFTDFKYETNTDLPGYKGWVDLPRDFSKNKELNITLREYTHVNRIKVFLHSGNHPYRPSKSVNVTDKETVVTFSPAELANLPVSTSGGFEIYFYNDETTAAGGKTVCFSNATIQIMNNVVIMN
ncbi:MAG TPA: hypothetical protein PL029_01685 [Bacteroidia bacterium]|nr:hypothetical protein [Bacteroidia bacterium]